MAMAMNEQPYLFERPARKQEGDFQVEDDEQDSDQ